MATAQVAPTPPPGFEVELPPPPAGFEVEPTASALPAPPPGFELDSPAAPIAPAALEAAPTTTPASGTLPTTDVPSALAAAPPVNLPDELTGAARPDFADLPTATVSEETAPAGRAPAALLAALQGGAADVTEAELGQALAAIERRQFDQGEALRFLLAPQLSPEGRRLLARALLTARLRAPSGAPKLLDEQLGTGAGRAFVESLAEGLRFGYGAPGRIAENDPNSLALSQAAAKRLGIEDVELAREAHNRALDVDEQLRREAHPLAAFLGVGAGQVPSFATGVQLLRAARAARGLPAVEAGTRGIVAEGAKVGGPQAFAYRPEGAEDMTAGEELAVRGAQAAIGVAAGAVLDAAGSKLADFVGRYLKLRADKKFAATLDREAQAAGFEDADTYIRSLTTIEQTPDGAVVRPRAEILDRLPGEPAEPPAGADTIQPSRETTPPESGTIPPTGETATATTALEAPDAVERRARLKARGDEYDRLAGQTEDHEVRATLARQAEIARTELAGLEPKLTRQERAERARKLDETRDDLITAIRKLGGIDTEIETDYAGRLSHLPRKGFGLPAIERPGKGRTLDDLAEALYERGYLEQRDVGELYNKLDRAAGGEDLYSFHADVERVAGERPRPRATDRDWTWTDAAEAEASGRDYVLTDHGAAVPARDMTLEDWVRLEKEMTDADEWFKREAGSDAARDTGGARADRLPQRVDDSLPGRGVEPEPGATPGAGDAARPVDKADFRLREPGPEKPPGAKEEPLRRELVDLYEFAFNNPENKQRVVRYRPVQASEAARLKAAAGVEVEGFDHVVDNYSVRHMLEQHGNPHIEKSRGQVAITEDDILRIPEIVDAPDRVSSAGLTKQGRETILYQKRIGDEVYYLEEVRTGKKQLAPVTMYKKKEAATSDAPALQRSPTQTPEAVSRPEDTIVPPPKGGKIEQPLPADRAGTAPETGRMADVPDARAELYLPGTAADAEHVAARENFGPRVRHVETGTFPSALRTVNAAADVAHATATLRKEAQESMLAVVTDDAGKVLRIARLFKGAHDEATVDPGLVAGAVANTPGARRAWFVHNHPSGRPAQTEADRALTDRLQELLRGSGIEPQGMVAIAPGGHYTHYRPGAPDATGDVAAAIPAGRRTEALPVSERKLVSGQEPSAPIETPEQLRAHVGDREGIVLLDNQKRPLRFVPMTAEEMSRLRQGGGGPSQRLLAAFDATPTARAFAARVGATGDEASRVAGNLDGFARVHGTPLVDVLDGAGESLARAKGIPEQSTFYANPFLHALGETARDIGLHPGRNLAAGVAGGVVGATTSEAEAGSAQWWLDVAAGAAGGVTLAQFARRTNLLGKGSIVDNARAHVGNWIEGLPLIGRGPSALRELKTKQRLMQDYLDRQTAEVGKHLLERFTPAERAMMADLIETRGIVKDLNVIHRQAQVLDDYLTHVAQRLKEMGMLPPDLEEGGYLHRYYAKHLGLDKLFREAKGQTLSGSWSLARGTDDVFDREYFSPGARAIVDEFEKVSREIARWERVAGDLLDAETQTRLAALKDRKRELGKVELREFLGHQNGRLRSFLFATDEVGRVDTGATSPAGVPFTPPGVRVHADRARPPAGSLDARAMPEAPGVADLQPTNYVWSVRGVKGKEALLHRDWTKAERQSWGEIEDAGYRYVRGMTEASHDLSLATLFDTIARKGDWVSAAPRATNGKAWVFVPDARVGKGSPLKKYGALAGQYVRPDVWNGIRGYGRNPLRGGPRIPGTGLHVGDLYLAALNKWKLYKTVYNPVTHFNNSYSNVEMLYMGGYNARTLARGVKHLAQGEDSAFWRDARDDGLFGSDWMTSLLGADGRGNQALAELAEQLRTQPEIPDAALVTSLVMDLKQWWIGTKQALAQADGVWKTGTALAEAMGKPALGGVRFTLKPVKAAARAMQRAYRFEDNVFKMAVYIAEREKGETREQAVAAAQRLFFDYQDLPEAIKLARDLPVGSPFISYPYFAVQAIAKNVAQNPERVLFLVAGYEALNYAVLTADGMGPGEYWQTESADEATSPPWDRGRALWGARNTVHLPFLEGYKLALGRAHALGNPFMTEAGGREKLPNVPGGGSFWGSSVFGGNPLHALLDAAVNEDWKGKEIYKPGAPAEEKAQKIAAYLYQAWAPSNVAMPGGYQQAKVIEGLANDVRTARAEGRDPGVIAPVVDAANRTAEALGFGQFTGLDRADNEIRTRDALLASFGVKLRPVRVEQSVDFETGRRETEKKKAAAWYQEKVRLHADGRLTDAQLQEADRAFDAALDRLDREQDRLFDAEAFLRKRAAGKK